MAHKPQRSCLPQSKFMNRWPFNAIHGNIFWHLGTRESAEPCVGHTGLLRGSWLVVDDHCIKDKGLRKQD